MAGGSLSAPRANFGPVNAWFDAYLDFLVCVGSVRLRIRHRRPDRARRSRSGSASSAASRSALRFPTGASLLDRRAAVPRHRLDRRLRHDDHGLVRRSAAAAALHHRLERVRRQVPDGRRSERQRGLVQFNTGVLTPDPPGAQPQPGTAVPARAGRDRVLALHDDPDAGLVLDGGLLVRRPVNRRDLNALDIAPMDCRASAARTRWSWRSKGRWIRGPRPPEDGPAHFTITPVNGHFPEATWHWTDPGHLPAAARTIAAVAGLKVDAHVVLGDQSALIPISALVDDQLQYALPLPFATTAAVAGVFQVYGGDAANLAAAIAAATSNETVTAGAAILSGINVFSQNRTALGLSASGLPPLARQALADQPLGAAVVDTAGDRANDETGRPAQADCGDRVDPGQVGVCLRSRGCAVLQSIAAPVTDAAPSTHTSVTGLLPSLLKASPRMAPPGFITPPAVVRATDHRAVRDRA